MVNLRNLGDKFLPQVSSIFQLGYQEFLGVLIYRQGTHIFIHMELQHHIYIPYLGGNLS